MPALDPSPDEEAWEAFLVFALDHMGGNPDNGLSNANLQTLEAAVGRQLPFELGLLLVLGVPDGDRWWRWDEDPAARVTDWNSALLDGILFDVEENGLWLPSWGDRPTASADRSAAVSQLVAEASPLLPIYGHRAMPLDVAVDETAPEANPVFSIVQTDIITYGTDLASWLHREFEVPLPMWPETATRTFPFWSDLM